MVRISSALADALGAKAGDLAYVSDRRTWLGGLRSTHVIIDEIIPDTAAFIELGPTARKTTIPHRREHQPMRVELLY